LGLAGDLTINGNREDIILIRSMDGIQTTSHLNLTSANWLSGPYQNIKPNDVIIVNPNAAMIKTAGYIGSISVFLGVFTVVLSSIILLTNL
jgi:polysaccharide export outer membrane protein